MSVHIPESVSGGLIQGLKLIHRGKVRDTYALPDHPDHRLVVASDRVSIFDFVLGSLIMYKGLVLTAMNIFWRLEICGDISHDLAAFGPGIDQFLPSHLRGRQHLQKRAIVVYKREPTEYEAIIRAYMMGSLWNAYREGRALCGVQLPPGIEQGDKLPEPIFTPTTKAIEGHDEEVPADEVNQKYPFMGPLAMRLFMRGSVIAAKKGIILADTKVEVSKDGDLIDELLTPDSSRFMLCSDYASRKPGTVAPANDKQLVRDWGITLGINKRKPEIQADVEWVGEQKVPDSIKEITSDRYLEIFERLTGQSLWEFQENVMSVHG